MVNKKRTSVYLDVDVVEDAQKMGVNISQVCNDALMDEITTRRHWIKERDEFRQWQAEKGLR